MTGRRKPAAGKGSKKKATKNPLSGLPQEVQQDFVTWLQWVVYYMESSKDPPVARLPWIPLNVSSQKIEDTSYFDDVMNCAKNVSGKYNVEMYRLMTDTMPFYLPKRYHSMDCLALQANSPKGQYWANAGFFLIFAQGHGSNYWSEIQEFKPKLDHFHNLRFVSPISKIAMFQDGLELCQTAEEFLLEPWVLVQLPWNAVLFHQWLVAALAEYYKILGEYADFQHIPYIFDVSDHIFQIESVLRLMSHKLARGFTMLEGLIEFVFLKEIFAVTDCIKNEVVEDLVRILRYLLSGKARDSLNALKRMCWKKSAMFQMRVRRNDIARSVQVENETFLYHYEFWRHGMFKHMFSYIHFKSNGPQLKAEFDEPPFMSTRMEPKWEAAMKKKYKNKVNWDDIKEVVDELIIQPGRIKGVTREEILDCVEDNMVILFYYNQYTKYLKTSSKWEGVQQRDAGVINNILNLSSDYMCAEALAAMTNQLHFVLIIFKEKRPTYLQAVDCDGPELSCEEIISTAKAVNTPGKTRTVANTLKDLKKKLACTDSTDCPAFEDGPTTVAIAFEARIKRIVYTMLESHYKSNDSWIKFYPEMTFVHYMLPCFVASYVTLANDNAVADEGKKWYLNFVHELIQSFETEENYKNTANCLVPKAHSPYLYLGGGEPSEEILRGRIELICKSLILGICGSEEGRCQIVEEMRDKFLTVLLGMTKCETSDAFRSVTDEMDLLNLEFLFAKMNRYLARIIWVLRKVSVCKYVDLPKNKMEDAMLICMFTMKVAQESELVTDKNYLLHLICELHYRIVQSFQHRYHPPGDSKGRFISLAHKAFAEEASSLTYEQLVSILMYTVVSQTKSSFRAKFSGEFWEPCRFDPVEIAFSCFVENDLWKLKQILINMLHKPEGNQDYSMTSSIETARSAPICFELPLNSLTKENVVKQTVGKKGSITFFPIRHCRWCGKVGEELKMCSECDKCGVDYLDKNWFCNVECEKIALQKVHKEEHTRCKMILSGQEI